MAQGYEQARHEAPLATVPSGQVRPQVEVKLLRTYGETQLVQFEADPEQAAQLDVQVTQSNPSAMVPEGQVS